MRPRKPKNKGLPANLYATKRNGNTYYRYKHPQTKKEHGMGSDRKMAIDAARNLNDKYLYRDSVDLVAKVEGGGKPFSEWLPKYRLILDERDLSTETRRQTKWLINKLESEFGRLPVDKITTRLIAEFLDRHPPRMSNRYRSALLDIFNQLAAGGLVEVNPVNRTLPRRNKVKRKRIDIEQYRVIHSHAEPHIQRAMDLGLVTCQRRDDLTAMKFSDIQDGWLYVTQHKTKRRIRIKVEGEIADVIKQCRDNVLSPWILHHTRTWTTCKAGDALHKDRISKGFAKARDACGLFKDWPKEELPTFHEIRSLGARLLEERGVNSAAFLGHKDRKMTIMYTDDRGLGWLDAVLNGK